MDIISRTKDASSADELDGVRRDGGHVVALSDRMLFPVVAPQLDWDGGA